MNEKICPLLSVGGGKPVPCFRESCMWWIRRISPDGEYLPGKCATADIAGGLACTADAIYGLDQHVG